MVDFAVEKRPPIVPEFFKLRDAVGWDAVPEDVSAAALAKSLFSVCVIVHGEVVGMGRVVGDDGLYFYIQDVIVLPEYQRQGIGSRIMEEITAYLDENLCEGAFVGLKSAPGLECFYKRYGFSGKEEDIPGLFMVKR
ncbi:MAG: GNAT family N-acetyltransferase [Gammaproteobacteria bacterium]